MIYVLRLASRVPRPRGARLRGAAGVARPSPLAPRRSAGPRARRGPDFGPLSPPAPAPGPTSRHPRALGLAPGP
eukprot:7174234-Prymnesium_polylepis.2